ncbi:MAG: proton-conducting transporter membrane subunit [Bacteroidota bacterium]
MNSTEILFYGILLQALSGLAAPFFKNEKRFNLIAHLGSAAGLVMSLTGVILFFFYPAWSTMTLFYHHYWGEVSLRFDGLSLFFLFVIQAAAIPSVIYSLSYQRHYIDNGRKTKTYVSCFILLIVSLQLLVLANHSILFLLLWEMMVLLSYANMTFESERKDVQKGSFMYFAASHMATLFLYFFFLLLHAVSGSWNFSDYHISGSDPLIYYSLAALGFIGFGLKAGFMPFHFWLPRAHPVAPTYLSAFLSGVIIKLGIYGIIRTFEFISPVQPVIGWTLLGISFVSAVIGVWYALAQHDIKTLLAYHSIENIGIIGIGLAAGALGAAYGNQAAAVLGYSGALLHTLNHALFKSQLFIGSGIIYQNLHTRDIEKMGGLIRYAPVFAVLFLLGSVAIAGIPPLNGFISEFLIYYGFFTSGYSPVFMLLSVAGLALIGGLAVACFAKVNSIIFLGVQRSSYPEIKISRAEYTALLLPAALCVVIGVFPVPFIRLVTGIFRTTRLMPEQNILHESFMPDFSFMSVVFVILIATMGLLFFIRNSIQKSAGKRTSIPWGCGYQRLDSRMQYTASSFADELNTIPANILMIDKDVKYPETLLPGESHYSSHAQDLVEKKLLMPVYQSVLRSIRLAVLPGESNVRSYIAYILIALVIYSIAGFLWR